MQSKDKCDKKGTCRQVVSYVYIYINKEKYYESQPGSWLVVICERSENRGSGGVVAKRVKNGGNRWCFSSGQSMVLQGNVPGGKTVTVGIDSP